MWSSLDTLDISELMTPLCRPTMTLSSDKLHFCACQLGGGGGGSLAGRSYYAISLLASEQIQVFITTYESNSIFVYKSLINE